MVDESPLTVAQEMANVIFNLSQTEGQKLTADECVQLKRLYDRWNIASVPRAGAVAPRVPKGNFVTVVIPENAEWGIPTQGTEVFDGNGTKLTGVTLMRIEATVDDLWKAKFEAFAQIKRPSEL